MPKIMKDNKKGHDNKHSFLNSKNYSLPPICLFNRYISYFIIHLCKFRGGFSFKNIVPLGK